MLPVVVVRMAVLLRRWSVMSFFGPNFMSWQDNLVVTPVFMVG
jgi:hypothetical protein